MSVTKQLANGLSRFNHAVFGKKTANYLKSINWLTEEDWESLIDKAVGVAGEGSMAWLLPNDSVIEGNDDHANLIMHLW